MRYVKVNLNLSSLKLDTATIRYFNAAKVTQFGPGKGNPSKAVTGVNALMADLGTYKGNVAVYAYAKDESGTTVAATLQPSVPVSAIPEIAKAIIAEARSGDKHGPALKIEPPRKPVKTVKAKSVKVPVESGSDTRIDAMEAGLEDVKSTLTSIQSMLAALATLVPTAPRTRKPKAE